MKVTKIYKDETTASVNHYIVRYTGKKNLAIGEMFFYQSNKDKQEFAYQVLEFKAGSRRQMRVRKLTPAIYVWTTEAYQKCNIYKIGLVNWQSVENRLKQTDTTGVLQPIQLIEHFELATKDPNVTENVEETIHTTLEMMSDPVTGKSLRERSNRESFRGDWETVLRPVVTKVINEKCGEVKTTSQFPIQRHYQYAAEKLALQHYLTEDRGWIHWTCGTGKSYGLFWIMKAMFKRVKDSNNTAIVYVPSKHLIVQTGNDLKMVAEGLGYKVNLLSVYSEKDGADATAIATALNAANENIVTVVISTYQSNDIVRNGLAASNHNSFDALIGDEIHKTSGEEGKLFQNAIRKTKAVKRLYMTASPVCYVENNYGYSGQENENLYGKCFHSYGFLEAMFDKYITPLEIYGLGADTEQLEELKELIDYKDRVIPSDNEWDINHSNFTYVSMLYMTLVALRDGLITHPIIYTNRVSRGERFMEDLIKLAPKFGVALNFGNVKVLSGADNVRDRVKYINNIFSKQPMSVLINSRCLQEGVSASKADSVIIIDPRHSAADLIQILGRPVRLDAGNPDKVAKIFIPMVVEKNNEGKIKFNETCFGATRDWLTAITSSDADFASYFADSVDVFKVNFDNDTRAGYSYKEVQDPSQPKLPSPKNSEVSNKEDIAPYEFPKELLENLKLEVFKKVSSNKVKREMKSTEVALRSNCVVIHDHIMQEIQKGNVYLDTFKYSQRNKYASFYTESEETMIEDLISKTGANKKDLTDCLSAYTNELKQLNSLKKKLKLKTSLELIAN